MPYAPLYVTRPDLWIDLPDAAEHAAVSHADIVAAITVRELQAITTHPQRPGDWMVRLGDIEDWMARRRPAS